MSAFDAYSIIASMLAGVAAAGFSGFALGRMLRDRHHEIQVAHLDEQLVVMREKYATLQGRFVRRAP
jgi:hypothetical protein